MTVISALDRPSSGSSRRRSGGVVTSSLDRPREEFRAQLRQRAQRPRQFDPATGRRTGAGDSSLQERFQRAGEKNVGPGPGFTPIRVVLDVASAPFYAVGNLAAGRPGQAALNIATFGQRGNKAFVSEAPIVRRLINRIPGPSWARGAAGFAIDFATDPLTYVSFGAGGAIRGAAGKAAREAERRAAQQLREAQKSAIAGGQRRADPRSIIEPVVAAAEARAAAPRTFKVFLRTPLSRNKGRLLFESRRVASAGRAAWRPIRESTAGTALRRTLRADRGTSEIAAEGWRAKRYWATAVEREYEQRVNRLVKYARSQGIRSKEDLARITRHLDQPNVYTPRTPQESAVYRVAQGIRDDLEKMSRRAGIDMQYVESYAMHMPADTKTREALAKRFGRKAENQSYTMRRNPRLRTLDDWEAAGLRPELDPARVLMARARQGIEDVATKGWMDTMAARGVKPPPRAPVDVGAAAIRRADAQGRLESLVRRRPDAGATARARQARADLRAAQAGLRAARKQADAAGIARAERQLAQAQERLSSALSARATRTSTGVIRVKRGVEVYLPVGSTSARYSGGVAKGVQVGDDLIVVNVSNRGGKPSYVVARRDVESRIDPAFQAPVGEAREGMARLTFDADFRYPQEVARFGRQAEAIKHAREIAASASSEEIKAARAAARREVVRARRRLAVAQRSKDRLAIQQAERGVRDAARTERAVSQELAVTRASYEGRPREVAAATREAIRADRAYRRAESQARKVDAYNRRLAQSPAREVTREEMRTYTLQEWQRHTSKYHREVLVPPEIREAIDRIDLEMTKLVTSDASVSAFTHFFNQLGAAWKSIALMTPRYHLRNLMDDGLADWLAGARNPVSYIRDAPAIMRRAEGSFKTPNGRMTYREAAAQAEALGVADMGFAAYELRMQQRVGPHKRLPGWLPVAGGSRVFAPGSGRMAQASRWAGEKRENWQRLGLFVERLKAGDDVITAARTVRLYRYDYGDLSPFLQKARQLAIPFLTFTWKTMPLLGTQLARRPGAFSKTNIVIEYLQSAAGDPDRSTLAPWERDSFGVPDPTGGKIAAFFGAEAGEGLMFNPRITFRYADLEMLNPQRLGPNLGGFVGPIAAPGQFVYDFSLFQGRQRKPGERTYAPSFFEYLQGRPGTGFLDIGPKKDDFTEEEHLGYSARWHDVLTTLPPFQHVAGLTTPRRQRNALARWATGLNLTPEEEARRRFYAEQAANR